MYNIDEVINQYGEQLFNEQLEKEAKYKAMAMERVQASYDKAKADGLSAQTKLGQKMMTFRPDKDRAQTIFDDAVNGVRHFMENTLRSHKGIKHKYAEIAQVLNDTYKVHEGGLDHLYEVLTFATFSNMLSAVINNPVAILNNVTQKVGVEVQDEYNLQAYLNQLENETDTKTAKQREQVIEKGLDKRVQANYKRVYARVMMKHGGYEIQKFDNSDLQNFCVQLVHVIMDTTGFFVMGNNAPKNMSTVEATDELLDAWNKNEKNVVANAYKVCPTVIPPRPWTSFDEGGYYGDLISVSTLIRLHDIKTYYGRAFINKLNQTDISKVLKAVNAIQATPWKVNQEVLSVVLELVKRGGDRAKLPNVYKAEPPVKFAIPDKPTPEELSEYKAKMPDYYKAEARRAGIVLSMNSTIRIAQDFAKYERIYFPCNLDFRGRVYSIPSGLSFQGADLGKGLIQFADVPPIKSEEDIRWFAIHTANVAGKDKVSFDDRVKWTYENMDNILAAAEDPIGNHWWDNQDKKPIQLLACCLAWKHLKEYQDAHNGSSVGFELGIPIAMDGTCSGLQLFSAILRDPIGGSAVNLVPSEKPSDIYGIVADKVNVMLKEDAINGTSDEAKEGKVTYGTKTKAQIWLAYGVTRKVTKRSTMTLAYGSKEYGFRDQIMTDVIEKDWNDHGKENSVFTEDNRWQLSAYMAKLIWQAVNGTVVKAMEGMKWLQECAKIVSKNGQVVTWETPMGLPVQQSYMETQSKAIRLRCAGKQIRLYENVQTGKICKSKQSSGISPNFIHSCDAAVLQFITCNAVDSDIHHFAMIHDSYGVPASQTSIMYKISRESFVRMFTENDVFAKFREDMQALTDKKLPEPPEKDSLDLTQVLESKYIFS